VILGTENYSVPTKLPSILNYEELMKMAPEHFDFPQDIDENEALGLCYTSGTTGNPKGALYSHRSTVITCFSLSMVDSYAVSEKETILPIVPMFHANAWGYPFAAAMNGSNLVLPGRDLSPESITRLIIDHKVTFAAGVPTIWLGIYQYWKAKNIPRNSFSNLRIISGGSAVPPSLIRAMEEEYGVHMTHAWGMTETSPLGTVSKLNQRMLSLSREKQLQMRSKQGSPVPGIEIRIVDEGGKEMPWNGKDFGEIQVRGPYVVSSYFKNPSRDAFTEDHWFRTGDVGSIDENGFMSIVDRTKDLIKSGGEWISSVEMETLIMSHPKVLECAVIGTYDPKFQERPMAIVSLVKGKSYQLSSEELIQFLQTKVAKWMIPSEYIFVEEIVKTSVGKFDKKELRRRYSKAKL